MILPAHTQRLIRNRGMAALYGIAAEHDCDVSDVLDILVTAPLLPQIANLANSPSFTPSQPEVLTHAPAAQTDGEHVASQQSSPSVDLSGLAAHEQGPTPSPAVPPADDAADGQAVTLQSAPSAATDTEAPTPLPEGRGQRASVVKTRPAEEKTSEQEDGGEVSAVKGRARLENAEGVEPPPSTPSKRVTNRQRVRECHEAHPDWTAQQVADETGLSKDNVWTIASQIKIKWPDRKASTTEALQRATAKPQEPEAASDASEAQPAPEQPPASTADDLNERLIALHTAEPTLTRPELARRLGVTVGKVNYRVERLILDVPHSRRTDDEPFTPEVIPPANPQKPVAPPPPRTGTLTDRVRALHEQHPTWTARMIANELGANVNSVSTLLAEVRGTPSAGPAQRQQFTGRMDMINHYSEVAKRLGKPS